MIITIQYERSPYWLRNERCRSGDNAPVEHQVEVDASTLAEHTRDLLLDLGGGAYPTTCRRVAVDAGGAPTHDSPYATPVGVAMLQFDGNSPSPEEVDAMFAAALAEARRNAREVIAEQLDRLIQLVERLESIVGE